MGFYTAFQPFDPAFNYLGCVLSIPNGGKREAIDSLMMKREGLLVGASDTVVMLNNGVTLWIEFKTTGGVQRPKQKDFQSVCAGLGHNYFLVWSSFEAMKIVKSYLTK